MSLIGRLIDKLLTKGSITLLPPGKKPRTYGPGGGKHLTVRLTDRKVGFDILKSPSLGVGEAYMDGRLVVEDGTILDLLAMVQDSNRWEDAAEARALGRDLKRLFRKLKRNTPSRSRRNVAHHYDLRDELYELFLDDDKQYSCAYFTDPDNSLERAQADKKAHIAAKLALEPGQRVLDIGCGWGGMALYLNWVADVDVLGVTLSEEQLKIARARAEAAGVSGRVRFELIDYRQVTGRFDRIVSVGMFEHVGPPYYRTFFDKCRDLLAPDGVMLLHTIGRADGPGATDPWLTRYIFPGGYVPALSQIMPAIERSYLWVTDIEALRLHYAYTTAAWYERVTAHEAEITGLYDARFFRMWQFYLAGAVAAFRHDGHLVFQIQLTRKRDAVPIVRTYMEREERRLRGGG